MRITALIENTCGNPECACEHGLSIYIETEKHKLLCDTGASEAIFKNAEVLGIDLSKLDTIILSHGHYDHSGGIMRLACINPHARIFMRETALDDHYHDERYIGIDKKIKNLTNVIFTGESQKIDDEIFLFSKITGRRCFSKSNLVLSTHADGKILQDSFDHEQCLVVTYGEKRILISGCAHNGILNIIDRYKEIYKGLPDIVISGFHFHKKTDFTDEEICDIKETAEELAKNDVIYYTGHCTNEKAFDIMKPIMGDKLHHIHSGCEILPGKHKDDTDKKIYRVIQIFEREFGCEEMPDDVEPEVDVKLESQDGRQQIIRQNDVYLYKMKINEGDSVCISDDGKLTAVSAL